MEDERTYTAFLGSRCIASGDLRTMLLRTKAEVDRAPTEPILIFEDQTGQQVVGVEGPCIGSAHPASLEGRGTRRRRQSHACAQS